MKRLTRRLAWLGALLALGGDAVADETVEDYLYDAAGRLATVLYTCGSTNAAFHYAYDLAGNRVLSRTYGPGSQATDDDGNGLPDLWELAYFSSLGNPASGDSDGDGLANSVEMALGGNPLLSDTDGDGQSDYDESVAGTSLNNATSYFHITFVSNWPSGRLLSFPSVSNRQYRLQRSADLVSGSWTNVPGAGPVGGNGGGLALSDTNAASRGFYRVEVQTP